MHPRNPLYGRQSNPMDTLHRLGMAVRCYSNIHSSQTVEILVSYEFSRKIWVNGITGYGYIPFAGEGFEPAAHSLAMPYEGGIEC